MAGAGSWATSRSIYLLPNAPEGVAPSGLLVYGAGDRTQPNGLVPEFSGSEVGTTVGKSATCMQT